MYLFRLKIFLFCATVFPFLHTYCCLLIYFWPVCSSHCVAWSGRMFSEQRIWKGCGKKRLWPDLRLCAIICLERLKITIKIRIQDSRSLGWDLNRGSTECKAGMLPIWSKCLKVSQTDIPLHRLVCSNNLRNIY
jgi:hypothetical protein